MILPLSHITHIVSDISGADAERESVIKQWLSNQAPPISGMAEDTHTLPGHLLREKDTGAPNNVSEQNIYNPVAKIFVHRTEASAFVFKDTNRYLSPF